MKTQLVCSGQVLKEPISSETPWDVWLLLLERSDCARTVVSQNMPEMLGRLSAELHCHATQSQSWTPALKAKLHQSVKMVLNLAQHLPCQMRQLVWSAREDNLGDCQAQHLRDIISNLIIILSDEGYPRESVLLCGTTVAFILCLGENYSEVAAQTLGIYNHLGIEGKVMIGKICINTRTCTQPETLHFGHLGLVNGILSCSHSDLLHQHLPCHKSDFRMLHWILSIIKQLCDTSACSFHAFKMLALWFRKMSKHLPSLLSYVEKTLFDRDSMVVDQTLELIWTHLDCPVDGVNAIVQEVFKLLLDLHQRESNRQQESKTSLDKENVELTSVGCQISTGEQPPTVSNTLQVNRLAGELLPEILAMSWQIRGKHSLLGVLLRYLDIIKFLREHSDVFPALLECMSTNYLSPAATDFYKAVLSQLKVQDVDMVESWREHCMPWLLSALTSEHSLLKHYTIHLWLPLTLSAIPDALILLLVELQAKLGTIRQGDRKHWLHGCIAVLKAASSLQASEVSIPHDLVREALCSPEDEVRLEAFALLCDSQKKAEPLREDILVLLKTSLVYSLNSDCPPFRQQLQSHLRTAMVRLRDSCLGLLKKNIKKSEQDEDKTEPLAPQVLQAIQFADWLWQLCINNLTPAASFQRMKTSLDWTWVVLDTLHYSADRRNKKGSCPESSKILVSTAQQLGYLDMFSPRATTHLLACILHDTDEVRELAAEILMQFFPWPLVLHREVDVNVEDAMCQLLSTGFRLCNSPKARDCESGALLCKMFFKKVILTKGARFAVKREGAMYEVSYVGTMSTESASLSFITVLCEEMCSACRRAQLNVLEAAKQHPAHGFILALRRCLLEVHPNMESFDLWRPLIQTIVKTVEKLIDLVLLTMGGQLPDTDTSPSFEQMGVAINALSAETDATSSQEDAILTPQHQMIMTWAWINIRESSILLGHLLDRLPIDGCNGGVLSTGTVQHIANIFIKTLTTCRHRGAIEGCNVGFAHFCSRLLSQSISELHDIPSQLLDKVLLEVCSRSTGSVTRRSAGLPLIVQSIVVSESKHKQTILLDTAVQRLLIILKTPVAADQDQRLDIPQVHAMHILKAIVLESSIAFAVRSYLASLTVEAIKGFSSPIWAIRNAATQLFGSVVHRLLGQKKTKEGNLVTTTATELFGQYPDLRRFFLQHLREAASISIDNKLTLHPCLFPILTILAKLGTGVTTETGVSLMAELREPILSLGASALYAVRQLAAQALVPLVPDQLLTTFTLQLLQDLPSSAATCYSFNLLHGRLTQIRRLLPRLMTSGTLSEVGDVLVSNSWLCMSTNPSPLVRATFVQLINNITKMTGHSSYEIFTSCVEEQIHHVMKSQTWQTGSQIGQSEFQKSVVQLWLNWCAEERLTPLVSQLLQSKNVEVLLACLQSLADWIPNVKRPMQFWQAVQIETLKILKDNDLWIIQCEVMELLVMLHQHTTTCPVDGEILEQVWSSLCNMMRSRRHSKPAAQALTVSAILVRNHYSQHAIRDQLSDWCNVVVECSAPSGGDLLRYHAANALDITGAFLLQLPENCLPNGVLHSRTRLFVAASQLLFDEDSEVRKKAADFVIQLPHNHHTDIPWLYRYIGEQGILCEELFSSLTNGVGLVDVIKGGFQDQATEIFERQDVNPYAEMTVYQTLIEKTLRKVLKEGLWKPKSVWLELHAEAVCQEADSAIILVRQMCLGRGVLNVSCCKAVYEGFRGTCLKLQLLKQMCEVNELPDLEAKLTQVSTIIQQMYFLHPGIHEAICST